MAIHRQNSKDKSKPSCQETLDGLVDQNSEVIIVDDWSFLKTFKDHPDSCCKICASIVKDALGGFENLRRGLAAADLSEALSARYVGVSEPPFKEGDEAYIQGFNETHQDESNLFVLTNGTWVLKSRLPLDPSKHENMK